MKRHAMHRATVVLFGLAACSSAPAPAVGPAPRATASVPAPVAPPAASAPAGFHASRIVVAKDSFVVVAGGQTLGYSLIAVSREGANYRIVTDNSIPIMRIQQSESILFDGTSLMTINYNAGGAAAGMPMVSNVTVANGRATGSVQEPGPAGIKTTPVDLAIPAGAICDDALFALLPTFDLSDTFALSFTTFDASPGELLPTQLKVTGRETVTVPAGTFETYRIELTQKTPAMMFVTVAAPHRLVLARIEGGQVEMRLSK